MSFGRGIGLSLLGLSLGIRGFTPFLTMKGQIWLRLLGSLNLRVPNIEGRGGCRLGFSFKVLATRTRLNDLPFTQPNLAQG